MQKFYKLLLLFCLSCLLTLSVFAEEKKYPPYPDVWGYDLSSYPAVRDRQGLIFAYITANDEVYFIIRSQVKFKLNKNGIRKIVSEKYIILNFFTQEAKEVDQQEMRNFIKSHVGTKIDVGSGAIKVVFNDGSYYKWDEVSNGKLCRYDDIWQASFIKYDKKDKEIGKYSILAAHPIIEEIEDHSSASCEVTALENPIYKQLYFLPFNLIKLKDDTFIVFYCDRNLIVRFDKDLNTKFKPKVNYKTRDGRELTTNLFVVPYSVIEDFMHEAFKEDSDSIAQSLQDKLLNYFIQQQK